MQRQQEKMGKKVFQVGNSPYRNPGVGKFGRLGKSTPQGSVFVQSECDSGGGMTIGREAGRDHKAGLPEMS